MKRWGIFALWLVVAAGSAGAEENAKPPAELKALDFYVGKWSLDGESRALGAEKFEKVSGTESCDWFPGGFAVVCRESTADSSGKTESLFILSYNAPKKVYSVYGTDSAGVIYAGAGRYGNGSWTWQTGTLTGTSVGRVQFKFREGDGGSRTMDVEVTNSTGAWFKVRSATLRPKK